MTMCLSFSVFSGSILIGGSPVSGLAQDGTSITLPSRRGLRFVSGALDDRRPIEGYESGRPFYPPPELRILASSNYSQHATNDYLQRPRRMPARCDHLFVRCSE